MKKSLKRTLSVVLAMAAVIVLLPITPTAEAATATGSTFNPTSGVMTADFNYQYQQRVNIEIFVDGISR